MIKLNAYRCRKLTLFVWKFLFYVFLFLKWYYPILSSSGWSIDHLQIYYQQALLSDINFKGPERIRPKSKQRLKLNQYLCIEREEVTLLQIESKIWWKYRWNVCLVYIFLIGPIKNLLAHWNLLPKFGGNHW